jgi:hypothetical protein
VIDLNVLRCADQFDGFGSAREYDDTEQQEMNKRQSGLRLFRQTGAVVDLASNPFGWGDETQSDSDGLIITSAISNLQSIADAIRAAAARVESRRSTQQHTMSSQNYSEETQQPIPIIFDSLTPLLALHGAQNVSLLFQNFKQVMPSSSQSIAILSPIIAPIVYESIRPSDHRLLEDTSDAFMTLRMGDDICKSDAIASGVLDIVRRGGANNGLGGKLMRGCVPVHIMKATENSTNTFRRDVRDECYWIMEQADDEANSEGVNNKAMPQQHQKIKGKVQDAETEKQAASRPRIYLENNDPEFDDFDEEDPDDDLDL